MTPCDFRYLGWYSGNAESPAGAPVGRSRLAAAFGLLLWLAASGCSSAPGDVLSADLGTPGGGSAPDLARVEPVRVTVNIDGMGRVFSTPPGIDCPGTCSTRVLPSVKLSLRAEAGMRASFVEWTGACAGSNPSCVPPLNRDVAVTANFGPRRCSADAWCNEEPLPMEVAQLNRVYGSSDHDVWAVGSAGVVVHYPGLRWYLVDAKTGQNLVGLWGSGATDLWTAGGGQTLLHGDGTSFVAALPPAMPAIFSLWGAQKTDIWAFSGSPFSGAYFWHYDGAAWQKVTVGSSATILGIWGSSVSDIWGVGSLGQMLHFTGRTWDSVTAVTKNDLNDIWGDSPGNIWAVGNAGTVLHYDGATWQSVPSGTSASLRGIWGFGSRALWIVGDRGTLLRWDGHSLIPVQSGTLQALRGIWGSDEKNLWAVGDAVILRYQPEP